MPGNSFSQDRSTNGCSCASSHTSAALYSFGVIRGLSIPAALCLFLATSSTNVKPDGRALEAESLPELVHEEPLVGEVELRRDVREEHERRRRHAGLGGVH